MSAAAQLLAREPEDFHNRALTAFLKAAGDELRLNILRLLNQNDYGVLELCQLLDVKQSGMSHHLKVLANAGLVATRRDGNSIYYRRSLQACQPAIQPLQETLFCAVDQQDIADELKERIALINEERSRASREFFQQNSDRFQANQDLIASYAQYGSSICELLDSSHMNNLQALEVGPGQGELLADLASRFDRVTALDNSREMLDRATGFAKQQQLDNVSFVLGDTGDAVRQNLSADCITINMVLHHTPEPARIFRDLATMLNPGGVLLVTELCQHEQAWARESCGDLWLGFESDDLSRWATDAGLDAGEHLYLTQRNGFRVQLHTFLKPLNSATQ